MTGHTPSPSPSCAQIIAFTVAMAILCISPTQGHAAKLEFREGFALLVKKSETLINSELSHKIAQEEAKIAEPYYIPDLSAEASWTEVDASGANSSSATSGSGRSSTDQATVAKIVASKNLMSDIKYKPYYESKITSAKSQQIQHALALQTEFNKYATSYTTCYFMQLEIANLQRQEDTIAAQIKTLRKRVSIGRSRESDLLSFLSQENSLKASLLVKSNDYELCLQDMSELTGVSEITSLAKWQQQDLAPGTATAATALQSDSLELQIQANDQLRAANGRSEWPDLVAFGEYYPHRNGTAADNSKWGVGLKLTWSLYSGYQQGGQNQILNFQKQQLQNLKAKYATDFSLEKQQVQKTLKSMQQKLKIFEDSVSIAEKNYSSLKRDYNLGLINHLELLTSLNAVISANSSYLTAQKDYQLQLWKDHSLRQDWLNYE